MLLLLYHLITLSLLPSLSARAVPSEAAMVAGVREVIVLAFNVRVISRQKLIINVHPSGKGSNISY